MDEYGLTPQGPNIKRLDVILNEMHDELSDKLGINTRQNPQSLLNIILTNFADKIAELWEFGQDVYYSQYPSSATGVSLDNAVQFGGITRKPASKSFYPIHCTGIDDTKLAVGTQIASNTNPKTILVLNEEKKISRNNFNKIKIKLVISKRNETYSLIIDGDTFFYHSTSNAVEDILNGIVGSIANNDFNISVDNLSSTIELKSKSIDTNHSLILSENLTTETVTSILVFETVDYGNILVPNGAITEIINADPGLLSVENRCNYIQGNDRETDTELRMSYTDKIFNRSSFMSESIRSSILNNVQGASSVSIFENTSNETVDNIPPHSIEVVVNGGDNTEIATQILNKKAGGIGTYGNQSVTLHTSYDDEITINFSRPVRTYIWIKVEISTNSNEQLTSDYSNIAKDIIVSEIDNIEIGQKIYLQKYISKIFDKVSGISYIEISAFKTNNVLSQSPSSYPQKSVEITEREKPFTSKDMVEIVING